ncbi:MAG: PaaI family thioesterase [Firmicutes bacterium]|nr:PaaI family thioesterase [Bacillota bacterium]
MAKTLRDDSMCFACSPKNPIGLKLTFQQDGDVCRCRFTARPEHQGWRDLLHGGLIATLLDEVMAQWLWARGITAMTAEMTTRFSRAVPVGRELLLESRLEADRGKVAELSGRLVLPDGTVAARARAKFLKLDAENMAKGVLTLAKNGSPVSVEKEPEKQEPV